MESLSFLGQFTRLTLVRLCRQRWLLAGLALLCLVLPLGMGQAVQFLLSQGVDFDGVTLAVTAPAGDETPRLLEQYMGRMEDIAQYCRITAMEESEALKALQNGDITAVLSLPANFIRGVMQGDNPDLRLITRGDQPLESLLLLWVGQGASDILSAFQSGVYAVLDLYEDASPPGLTRDQVVMDINLRYISLALNRGAFFQTHTIPVPKTRPVPLHYALTLLAYFALSSAPLFLPIYTGNWLNFQRRLRSLGWGILPGCASGVLAGTCLLFLLLAPSLTLAAGAVSLPLLGAAALMAAYCSLFCAVCCLLSGSAAGCGALSFSLALVWLALAGGIVPPVLLPAGLREAVRLSPVTWLMELTAWPMGYPPVPASWAGLLLSSAGMAGLSLILYRRRTGWQEVSP